MKSLGNDTPIIVFAHIPLWTVYPDWGWGTDDSAQALAYLKRFGSVTVLNGHIHQTMQKVEGNVTFHTAMSTAFPQPAPGTAPSPGPVVSTDKKTIVSPALDTDEKFAYTFTAAGTNDYYCSVHPHMKGRIIVR